MPVGRKINSAPNPWCDFICAFKLPLRSGKVLSPLSQLLWNRAPDEFKLDQFLGAHPAAVHAKTWQGMWKAFDELLSAIDSYESDALQLNPVGSSAGEGLARVTRIWLEQVTAHLEIIKKIHNSYLPLAAGSKRPKRDIAKLVEPLWNPLSRCTGALKHGAAEILPLHYDASESGIVSGNYIAACSNLLKFGPHPHVHPNRGAWSYNRVISVVACGIFWAERLVRDSMLGAAEKLGSKPDRDGVQKVDASTLRKIFSRSKYVFSDELDLPFARARVREESVEFLVGTQHLDRPLFPPEVRIKSFLSMTDVYRGYTFELPYWPVVRASSIVAIAYPCFTVGERVACALQSVSS